MYINIFRHLNVRGIAPIFLVLFLAACGGGGGGGGGGGPDTEAPVFLSGIVSAIATSPNDIDVSWVAATDNVSAASAIVYDIYLSTVTGGQNFSVANYISAAGATVHSITGLNADTEYFLVVRARDAAGNRSSNLEEASDITDVIIGDNTLPDFSTGVVSSTVVSISQINLSWTPLATDDISDPTNIVYDIYVSTTSGGQIFTAANYTTGPGATGYNVTGLSIGTGYHFVVRARDEAGNREFFQAEILATTVADSVAPTFGGLASATAVSPTQIDLSWAAASDDITAISDIVYDIFIATTSGGQGAANFTTAAGATSFSVTGLTDNTAYFFIVNARDAAGNLDANSVEMSALTDTIVGDTVAPTFAGGLDSATPFSATEIDLVWTPASDDVSAALAIVYDIYIATPTAGSQDFSIASITSAAGATIFRVGGLEANTAYHFVVRARDEAGNRDSNTTERSASTPVDTTEPTFDGLVSATAVGPNEISLVWTQATDDVSAQSAIAYDIFMSTTSGGQNLLSADFITPVEPPVLLPLV